MKRDLLHINHSSMLSLTRELRLSFYIQLKSNMSLSIILPSLRLPLIGLQHKVKFLPYLLWMLVFVSTSTRGWSQDTIPTGQRDTILRSDVVDVVKSFEANLEEARMFFIDPQAPPIEIKERLYGYNVTIVPFDMVFPEPIIRPISMRSDDPIKYKDQYVKLGYGNLKNAYGDLAIRKNLDDLTEWSLSANLRTGDNSDEIAFQKYRDVQLKAGVGFNVFETSRLEINAGLNHMGRHFFYDRPDRTSEFEDADVRRNSNTILSSLSFFNAFDNESRMDYRIDFNNRITRVNDLDANEINSRLYTSIIRRNEKNISFTIAGGIDINRVFENTDFIGMFDPSLTITGSKVLVDAGLSYIYANEKNHVFPNIKVKLSINDKALQVFAGANQLVHRNNVVNTLNYNSFSKGMDTLHAQISKDIFGGIQGKMSHLTYQGRVGYKNIRNQAVFNIDFQDSLRRLDASTADLNAFYIQGNLEYDLSNKFTLGGVLTQNFFTNVSTDEMWHIFPMELNAYLRGTLLSEVLVLRSDLFIRDSARALDMGETIRLPGMFDLSVEVEVNPTPSFGIWARALNLLDVQYSRWLGYPNFGIHIQGGVVARF